ncbi:MAG: hypothetical protein ONB16_08245, partial [candidate division KSB1 bacterium]|nr:hypothetical protein [candidate division KSB1 bacterium]
MILSTISTGVNQMWRYKRLVFIYYLINFLFGLVLMLPFRSLMRNFGGRSLMADELARRLDMDFLFEFIKNSQDSLAPALVLLAIVIISYSAVRLFLSGGALAVFVKQSPPAAPLFWSEASRYFGRFIRLLLWSLLVGGLLLCLPLFWSAIERLLFGGDPYQYITYYGNWLQFGLRHLGLILYLMTIDYARIYVVQTDERRMRVALWKALQFLARNFWRALGLALGLYLVGLVMLGTYSLVASQMQSPISAVILALFIWQQLYMIWRMMLQLVLFASEVQLYQDLSLTDRS